MTGNNPMGDMFEQIQKMQADMQAAQDALANATVEGTAGGGVVKAVASGDGALRSITIDPSVVDPGDVETLEDLVVAAVHEAMRKAKEMQAERMGAATGGIDLDSMLGGLGGLGGMLGGGDSGNGPHL
jgi:nucleoid-associated protein EbfC